MPCGLISLTPSEWCRSPLAVTWVHEDEGLDNRTAEVENWWCAETLERSLLQYAPPLRSWDELREAIEAKRRLAPMVILDCVRDIDPRGMPYLGNVPIIRMNSDRMDRLAIVVGCLLDEVFRTWLWLCWVGHHLTDSPGALGLSDGHLRDAMAEIALQVLASGRSLAYGGDLRQHGFTELLAELVGRYRNHPRHDGTIVVTDYLAWPVHIRMTSDEIAAFSAEHEPSTRLVFLALDGAHRTSKRRSPSSRGVCAESSVMGSTIGITMHKVFISYHRHNDQRYKNNLVEFGEKCSIFVDQSVDTGDVPDERQPSITGLTASTICTDS